MPVTPSEKEDARRRAQDTCRRGKETTEGVPLYAVSQVRYGTERTYDAQETNRCGALGSNAGPLKRR